jgi:hypothetical protein
VRKEVEQVEDVVRSGGAATRFRLSLLWREVVEDAVGVWVIVAVRGCRSWKDASATSNSRLPWPPCIVPIGSPPCGLPRPGAALARVPKRGQGVLAPSGEIHASSLFCCSALAAKACRVCAVRLIIHVNFQN